MGSFSSIINSGELVLIDFHALWCGPCKVLAPVLKDVKHDLGDQIKIIKIDVDKNQALSEALRIKGLPTLIIYKSGDMKWRQSGELDANTIIGLMQNHM